MKKWEYLVIKRPIRGFMGKEISPEAELNKFGGQGWELVSVGMLIVASTTNEAIFFFKREAKS